MSKRNIRSRRWIFISLGLAIVVALTVSVSMAMGECEEEAAPQLKVTPGERNFKVGEEQNLTVENEGGGDLKIFAESVEAAADFQIMSSCKGVTIKQKKPCVVTIKCKNAATGKYEVAFSFGPPASAVLKCT